MTIVFDMRWVFEQISGIGAYARELARRLPRLADTHQFVLLFNRPELERRERGLLALDDLPNVRTHTIRAGLFSVANQWRTPLWLRRVGATLYHSPNYMIPLPAFPADRRGRIACVTTIHDVIPMVFPRHAPRSRKARLYPVYRRLMIDIGRRADRILTDSECSRRDILHHLKLVPPHDAKVRTIYCGVHAPATLPPPPPASDPTRERTVLYVGRMDPYKNLDVLLQAVARLRRSAPFPLRLTLAGAHDPRYPETKARARDLGLGDSVTWAGYLSDAALGDAYRQADVLVHPSRYEGFGLQVLEAMAAGLPVVCSTGGSLPEVAGKAAVLVDPTDVEGFARAITDVLSDPRRAAALREAGFERARAFTWDRTASETLAVYEELARP